MWNKIIKTEKQNFPGSTSVLVQFRQRVAHLLHCQLLRIYCKLQSNLMFDLVFPVPLTRQSRVWLSLQGLTPDKAQLLRRRWKYGNVQLSWNLNSHQLGKNEPKNKVEKEQKECMQSQQWDLSSSGSSWVRFGEVGWGRWCWQWGLGSAAWGRASGECTSARCSMHRSKFIWQRAYLPSGTLIYLHRWRLGWLVQAEDEDEGKVNDNRQHRCPHNTHVARCLLLLLPLYSF